MATEAADKFLMQEGLLYTKPKYGTVFVFEEPSTGLVDRVNACIELKQVIADQWKPQVSTTKFNVVAGFDPEVWNQTMANVEGWSAAAGNLEMRKSPRQIIEGSDKFLNTGGFAVVMCRSVEKDVAGFHERLAIVEKQFNTIASKYGLTIDKTVCGAKDALSGLFVDGLGNKSESSALQAAVACKGGVNGYPGGSYMLQQKFRFAWDLLSEKGAHDLAKMIGRHKENTLVFGNNERTHLTRVHHVEPHPHNTSNFRIHRISMPFDDDEEKEETPGGFGGGSKESGLFYISFSKSQDYVMKLLTSMVGDRKGVTHDSLIASTTCMKGGFYYLPAVREFGMEPPGVLPMSDLLFDHWDVKPEDNEYLFYNHKEYMSRMSSARKANVSGEENAENDPYPDPPSQRVLHLVEEMFENWEDTWFHPRRADPIPHLYETSTDTNIKTYSKLLRQAHAVRLTLSSVYTTNDFTGDFKNSYGVANDLFRISPYDILAGKMPGYGLGIGQIAMPYLNPDPEGGLSAENIDAYAHKLNEVSGFGHVVPNYQTLIDAGIPGFLQQLQNRYNKCTDQTKKEYYYCCILVYTGVQEYMQNYANLATHLADKGTGSGVDYALNGDQIANLRVVADRMNYLANTGPPVTFIDAVQLILTLHACLHMTSEPVSIGRLDMMLEPFLQKEYDQFIADPQFYQDVIDAFWIKIGEKVQLSRETRLDLYKVGTIAVPYRSDGRFPRGDGCNQWVQQVTIGGYTSPDGVKLVPPSDTRNEIVKLCLKAARRLPLNAPCVSLRLHNMTNEEVLKEASKTILSGGAHPVIDHDDRIIPALQTTGLSLERAAGYSSDGCYEPIIPGKSEFSFCYVPLLQVLEMTINRGATISDAGPEGMRGYTVSQEFRPGSADIKSINDLKKQFAKHLRLQMNDALSFLGSYGNIYNIYASQMLSCMIDGCLDKGLDIYNGGADIKLIGLMAISFANTVDSIYAIQELCFGDDSQVSLDYLLLALMSDWGFNLQEPWQDPTDGKVSAEMRGLNMKLLREKSLKLPKYGLKTREDAKDAERLTTSNRESLKDIATWLAKEIVESFKDVTTDGKYPFCNSIRKGLDEKYPNEFHYALGSGTFEGYVGWGLGCAASADGRRKAQPIASDMSPTPTPQDVSDTVVKIDDIYKILPYMDIEELKTKYSNGCEIDLTISEATDENNLTDFLRHYANQEKNLGGNILTITVADQDTFHGAMKNPEQYDLVRVRTGGWTEFYISFYSPHQLQHLRRTRAIIPPASGDSMVVDEKGAVRRLSKREARRKEKQAKREQRRLEKRAKRKAERQEERAERHDERSRKHRKSR
ncbi:uncharacterized protein [Clytia hemisphaerica]|uniref:PFL domain-containing protein n=1 Tax=Clytia hemisphaerica TaxID=252671 RepID=A0A7M5XBF3_9CNID|eukprot:TCONS_00018921-protein